MADANNNNTTTTTTSTGDVDPKQQLIEFKCALEKESVAYNATEEIMLLASFKAPAMEDKTRDSRAPVDLVVVIDKSGSMAGEKLRLVKDTLKFMISQLKEDDKLCIVLYDSNVEVPFKLQKLGAQEKKTALSQISQIKEGSMTNLSGGLLKGVEELISRKEKNEVAAIMLFTDGLANEGIQKSADIVRALEKTIVNVDSACSIFTFGYGADHDENMMRAIAESGKGMYYFIETPDKIAESFGDCLGGLLSVAAQNISLSVEGLDGSTIVKVVSEVKGGSKSGKNIEVPLGDLYSEEERDIVLLASLPSKNEYHEDFRPVFNVTLSYFNVITSSFEKRQATAYIKRTKEADVTQKVNPLLVKQKNRLNAFEAMENARKPGVSREEGKKILKKAMDDINCSDMKGDAYSKALVEDIDETLQELEDVNSNEQNVKKKMASKAVAHQAQRGCVNTKMYSNNAKAEMLMKAKSALSKK